MFFIILLLIIPFTAQAGTCPFQKLVSVGIERTTRIQLMECVAGEYQFTIIKDLDGGSEEAEFNQQFSRGQNPMILEKYFGGQKIHKYPLNKPNEGGVRWTFVFEKDWQKAVNLPGSNCPDEWKLGRAIQVAPTNSTDSNWPKWKAKIGVYSSNIVYFMDEAYFNVNPDAKMLSDAFNIPVHPKPWYTNAEKNRKFYVFEVDYAKHISTAASLQPIFSLLLSRKNARNIYTPDNPMPGMDNEGIISLWEKSWQQVYPDGAFFVQVDVRVGGAKVKFLQKFTNQAAPFAVYRETPIVDGWILGTKPFDLKKAFPGYNFGPGFYPGADTTHWSARVYIP